MKRLITLLVLSLAWILITRTDLIAGQQNDMTGNVGYHFQSPESGMRKIKPKSNKSLIAKQKLREEEWRKRTNKVKKPYPGMKSGANDTILSNYDSYTVPVASFYIGGTELPELPAGFFGAGSDPFSGTILFAGYNSTGIIPFPDAEIYRYDDIYFQEPYPSTGRSYIETDLGLVSITPITVTYNNGQYSEQWNVEMYNAIGGWKDGDSINIIKTGSDGGYFYYGPFRIQPSFYFWNDDEGFYWDTGDSIPPISYIQQNNAGWEHSPIGQDFNPDENDTLEMISETAESYFNLVPLLMRDDNFSATADDAGNVTGNGSGYNQGEWYYYPGMDMWMAWFYDHPLETDRVKSLYSSITISSSAYPSEAEVYLGWSTQDWTNYGGVPGEPPLPQYIDPSEEELNISLSGSPFFSGELDGTEYPYIDYQITDYNPEWVCIAVKGVNFDISYGYVEHVCFDPGWDNYDYDWGDAPDPAYPTLAANNGARHRIFYPGYGDTLALGSLIDAETDGQPNATAFGDDINGIDDEDGLDDISELKPGNEASITISVSQSGGYLNAWLDFNGDGDWDDNGEHIIINNQIWDSQITEDFDVPFYAVEGQTTLRLRYSSFAGPGYSGAALDGEVEDYAVIIEPLGNKWEQLPDSNLYGYESHDYNNGSNYLIMSVADDWQCNGGWVNKIEWWGFYSGNEGVEMRGAGIDHFNIQILPHYESCDPASWAVYTVDIPFDSVYEQNAGWTNYFDDSVYHYVCNLHEPFIQQQGQKYWLVITAISNDPDDPAVWNWQESANLEVPALCGGHYRVLPYQGWSEIIRGEWPVLYPDYAFVIHSESPLPADFGDAPEGENIYYPVTLANDGAIHIIDPSVYLGAGVDAEPDGLPGNNALGDDNSGIDDEDGVLFLTPLISGQVATIQVTASVTGYLNAWADFAHWDEWEDQQIFDDYLLAPGINILSFTVPFDAVEGNTFFRFRFSTKPGLECYGQAPDGEVEDYMAQVTREENKWLQAPSENLTGVSSYDYYIDGLLAGNKSADDWICMGGNVISLRWWGTYNLDDNTGQEKRGSGINHFHLSFNLNNQDNEPSSVEQWSADVPFVQVQETNTGFVNADSAIIYEYSYNLPVPFNQIAGEHYWLTMIAYCNDSTNPAEWKWQKSKRSSSPTLNPAMVFPIDDPSWITITDNGLYLDLAFEIYSDSYYDYDYGDAPYPYPTLADDDGAIHIIDTTLYLGNSIDGEDDGQPDSYAQGDDQNGIDDEDGVQIPGLYPGYNATFTVLASDTGYLNAWIDFDNDGEWEEGEEHLIVDEQLLPGYNYVNGLISGEVENGGYRFARFRFSSVQGLDPTGIAPDGEVEDYRVYIEDEVPYKWQQSPETDYYPVQVNAAPPYLLADDFTCDKTGPLTEISIYGYWLNNDIPSGGVDNATFTLSIHDAAPNGDGTMPGDLLWTHTYNQGDYNYEYIAYEKNFDWQNPDGTGYSPSANMACVKYNFEIPEGEFKQEGTPYLPIRYWLTLQVETDSLNPGCKFGWNNTYPSNKIGVTNPDNAMWTVGTEPYMGIWDSVFYADGHPYEGYPMGFAFDIKGLEDPYILLTVNATPEFSTNWDKNGNPDFAETVIPLHQPFGSNPSARWYYDGDEEAEYIPYPGFTLDWVLVELRDAPSPALATDATVIARLPAFVDMDGDIFGTNEDTQLKFYINPVNTPYVVIWQRNHLGVLSSSPINPDGTQNGFEYYFDNPSDAYGGTNALKYTYMYGWVMYGGDVNGDGVVDEQTDIPAWQLQAGEHGYLEGDVNLDSEVDNKDKDDIIIENSGKVCQIPE